MLQAFLRMTTFFLAWVLQNKDDIVIVSDSLTQKFPLRSAKEAELNEKRARDKGEKLPEEAR